MEFKRSRYEKGIKLGILITILFTSTKVYASCNDSKLNDYAEKVKVVYKEEVKQMIIIQSMHMYCYLVRTMNK